MLAVSVDLGSIEVTGKKPNLSLTLSCSFWIVLPPSWADHPTADELCQASSAGKIWISKAGSCQIDLFTLANDELPDAATFEPSIMATIANLASECPIWKDIGLELRVNHALHAAPYQSCPQASYFLCHPDLSSEMIAPPDIPSARFQGLRCKANYHFQMPSSTVQVLPQSPVEPQKQHAPEAPPSHTYSLRSNPRRTRKAAVAHEEGINTTIVSASTSTSMPEPYQSYHLQENEQSFSPEAMLADMNCLLDFAFRKIIGVKTSSSGIRTVKGLSSPSLVDIAPAVWNLQYLQTMTAHSQVIPSIAAGIARLKNAQSASLREKLDRITHQTAPGSNSSTRALDEDNAITNQVKKRLWMLCQTRIRPEPIKGNHGKRKMRENTTDESQSLSSHAGMELTERGVPQHYQDDSISSNAPFDVEHHELWEGHDTYPDVPQEVWCGPNASETHGYLQADASYDMTDADLTNSSEADYFYTDGHGNIYPIERHPVSEPDEVGWAATSQLVEPEDFSEEEEHEIGTYGGENVNQAYIMYQEVHHMLPPSRAQMEIQGDARRSSHLLDLEEALPFGGWPGD